MRSENPDPRRGAEETRAETFIRQGLILMQTCSTVTNNKGAIIATAPLEPGMVLTGHRFRTQILVSPESPVNLPGSHAQWSEVNGGAEHGKPYRGISPKGTGRERTEYLGRGAVKTGSVTRVPRPLQGSTQCRAVQFLTSVRLGMGNCA